MTVRAAIVGTGFWASYAHVPALRAIPGVELDAVVGLTANLARRFAADQGFARAFTSVIELVDSDRRPDLLVVAAAVDATLRLGGTPPLLPDTTEQLAGTTTAAMAEG